LDKGVSVDVWEGTETGTDWFSPQIPKVQGPGAPLSKSETQPALPGFSPWTDAPREWPGGQKAGDYLLIREEITDPMTPMIDRGKALYTTIHQIGKGRITQVRGDGMTEVEQLRQQEGRPNANVWLMEPDGASSKRIAGARRAARARKQAQLSVSYAREPGQGGGNQRRRRRLFKQVWRLAKDGRVGFEAVGGSTHRGTDADDMVECALKPQAKVLHTSNAAIAKHLGGFKSVVRKTAEAQVTINDEAWSLIKQQADTLQQLARALAGSGSAAGPSTDKQAYDAIQTEDRLIVLNADALEAEPKRTNWLGTNK